MQGRKQELFLINSLKVFIILFVGSFILRIIGFDNFGFVENNLLIKLADFLESSGLNLLINLFTLTLSSYVIFRIACSNENKKIYYIVSISMTIVNLAFQILYISFAEETSNAINDIYIIVSLSILFLGIIIIDKSFKIKKAIIVLTLNTMYQLMIFFIRGVIYDEKYNTLYDFLLNFDYIILLMISYLIYLKKGRDFKCFQGLGEVGLSSLQQRSSKKLVKKSQKQSLSKEEKQQRISNIIYFILSIIWNVFTLLCVIFVSTLNTTLITTLFILTSFLITKSVFGKAFHMKSALTCFVVSNLVYFAISRITVSVNVSFWIPILLGVGLSYATSFLVKGQNIELYKGMNKEELKEICKLKSLNEYETNLLIDFYSNRMTLIKLSLKYNYSKETIFIHKKKALQKIKEN